MFSTTAPVPLFSSVILDWAELDEVQSHFTSWARSEQNGTLVSAVCGDPL